MVVDVHIVNVYHVFQVSRRGTAVQCSYQPRDPGVAQCYSTDPRQRRVQAQHQMAGERYLSSRCENLVVRCSGIDGDSLVAVERSDAPSLPRVHCTSCTRLRNRKTIPKTMRMRMVMMAYGLLAQSLFCDGLVSDIFSALRTRRLRLYGPKS